MSTMITMDTMDIMEAMEGVHNYQYHVYVDTKDKHLMVERVSSMYI